MALNAQASITAPLNALKFATEININATTGQDLANTGAMNVSANFGFGVDAGVTVYIRFDLSDGAKFKADPTYAISNTVATPADATVTQSAGGSGASYVIFSVTAPTGGLAATDIGTLTLDATGVTVFDQNSVAVTYALYQFAGDAVNQSSALNTDTKDLINWEAALKTTVTAVTPSKIDVTQDSKKFVAGDTTVIGQVGVDVSGALWTTGATATMSNLVAAGTSLDVAGDFSAVQDLTGGVPDGTFTMSNVFIDTTDLTCSTQDQDSDSLNATSASFTLDTNTLATTAQLCMTVNGVSQIGQGSYTGVYNVTAASGSNAADMNLGTLSTLTKNGSDDYLSFVLTPGGYFQDLVRITNPTTIAGAVHVTVYNDSGDNVSFNLADVPNVDGLVDGKLPAGASTNMMNLSDIYSAARTADSSFAVSGTSNKLRIVVSGEFGDNGNRDTNGAIIINAFSPSNDGTTLVQLK
jgi:hypothetical protein